MMTGGMESIPPVRLILTATLYLMDSACHKRPEAIDHQKELFQM